MDSVKSRPDLQLGQKLVRSEGLLSSRQCKQMWYYCKTQRDLKDRMKKKKGGGNLQWQWKQHILKEKKKDIKK